MKRVIFALALLMIVGCGTRHQTIPEDVLKNMIEDIMITDAVMTQLNMIRVSDSTDFYQPIFDKYGYTQGDMQYTLRQLAARQSKPISNIYDQISSDLLGLSTKFHYYYQRREKFDNMAIACYSDTVFRNDKVIHGSTANFKAVITDPIKGKYCFTFMYRGVHDYAMPMRNVKSELKYRDKKLKPREQSNWVNRSFTPTQVRFVVNVPDSVSYDSLVFKITDPDFSKSHFTLKQDTAISYNFRVTYIPEKGDAISRYFRKLSGIVLENKSDSTILDDILYGKKDSCTLGPVGKR